MECHELQRQPIKMRALALRCVSLFGLVVLIGWEVWKAGDMVTTIRGKRQICFSHLSFSARKTHLEKKFEIHMELQFSKMQEI